MVDFPARYVGLPECFPTSHDVLHSLSKIKAFSILHAMEHCTCGDKEVWLGLAGLGVFKRS